jgi:hypothetical protein
MKYLRIAYHQQEKAFLFLEFLPNFSIIYMKKGKNWIPLCGMFFLEVTILKFYHVIL